MLRGFAVSSLIHASVIAMAVLSWPQKKSECDRKIERLERDQPGLTGFDILERLPECASAIDLPIDIIDFEIASATNIAPIAKPAEEDVEQPPEPEEAPEQEPAPEDLKELTPDEELDVNKTKAAEPEDDDIVVEDEKAEPEKKVEDKPAEKPRPKEEKLIEKKPKASDDPLGFLDDAESLLKSKSQNARKAAPDEAPPPINKPVLSNAQKPREGAGDRSGNTATLQAAVRRQIGYCWNGVDDLPKEDQIDVVISIQLARDGSLSAPAELVMPRSRPVGRSGIPVDLALRAVRKCAPYKLPEDDYDQWKSINVTIGPKTQR